MRITVLVTGTAFLLSGCATTRYTAERRAECQRMTQEMGLQTTHDHAQMKGLPANSMNLTHERCQSILKQAPAG